MQDNIYKLFFYLFIFLFFQLPVIAQEKQNIVVTIPYIADILNNITCNSKKYKIISIIPNKVSLHTYILTPKDRLILKNAKIVVEIGAGLEYWMNKITFSADQKHIVLSKNIKLKTNRNVINPAHRHELKLDPHIWQSPALTKSAANVLANILLADNMQDKELLKSCTIQYLRKIDLIVKNLQQQADSIALKNRVIVSNHSALQYFADAFQFKLISMLGLSDIEQLSSKTMIDIISELRAKKINTVFLDDSSNTKNINILVHDAGLKIGGILYNDTLGPAGNTIDLWQMNMNTLVTALQ